MKPGKPTLHATLPSGRHAEFIQPPTPGLDEAMRHASLETTPMAMLSRAASGIRNTTLILSLPALRHGLALPRGDPFNH